MNAAKPRGLSILLGVGAAEEEALERLVLSVRADKRDPIIAVVVDEPVMAMARFVVQLAWLPVTRGYAYSHRWFDTNYLSALTEFDTGTAGRTMTVIATQVGQYTYTLALLEFEAYVEEVTGW